MNGVDDSAPRLTPPSLVARIRTAAGDILLPDDIVRAMQMQASAERRKRAQILDSEGARQAEVNIAEGRRQAAVLASEAAMLEKVNIAKGTEPTRARALPVDERPADARLQHQAVDGGRRGGR